MTGRQAPLEALARSLRHHVPWSYRLDVFVLLVLSYAALALLIGIPLVSHNHQAIDRVTASKSFPLYAPAAAAIIEYVDVTRRPRTLSEEQAKQVAGLKLVNDEPSDELSKKLSEALKVVDPDLARRHSVRFRFGLGLIDSDLQNRPVTVKFHEILTTREFWSGEIAARVLLPGRVLQGFELGFFTFSMLGVMLLFYHINNVFSTREIHIVLRHPQFLFLYAELLTVAFMPFIAVAIVDDQYMYRLSQIPIFVDNLSRYTIGDPYAPVGVVEQFIPVSDDADTDSASPYRLSQNVVFLSALVAWLASGLWIVRRFGWGIFLTASLASAAVLVVVVSTIPESSEIGLPSWSIPLGPVKIGSAQLRNHVLFIFIVIYLCCVVVGMRLGRAPLNSVLVCAGYVGTVVLTSYVLGNSLLFERQSKVVLIESLILIAAATSLAEWIARRIMFRFLYKPQP